MLLCRHLSSTDRYRHNNESNTDRKVCQPGEAAQSAWSSRGIAAQLSSLLSATDPQRRSAAPEATSLARANVKRSCLSTDAKVLISLFNLAAAGRSRLIVYSSGSRNRATSWRGVRQWRPQTMTATTMTAANRPPSRIFSDGWKKSPDIRISWISA